MSGLCLICFEYIGLEQWHSMNVCWINEWVVLKYYVISLWIIYKLPDSIAMLFCDYVNNCSHGILISGPMPI